MEKIKDFFYDLSDIFLSILIIIIIFTVVTWKISNSLDIPEVEISESNNILINEENNSKDNKNLINIVTVDENNQIESQNTNEPSSNKSNSNEDLDAKPDANETSTSSIDSSSTSTETSTNTSTETKKIETIKIHIKSGTSGYGIAKILKEKNLIEDTTIFIKRVEELDLGVSLRAGDFTLKSNMTLDEIIHTLAGK